MFRTTHQLAPKPVARKGSVTHVNTRDNTPSGLRGGREGPIKKNTWPDTRGGNTKKKKKFALVPVGLTSGKLSKNPMTPLKKTSVGGENEGTNLPPV